MSRYYDVITIGEATIDAFMTIDDSSSKVRVHSESGELCFRHGEKINVERYDFSMGGNAANVAVGLSRLGLKATLCAEIGDDEFSIKIRNTLAKENIERLFVVQKKDSASNFSVVINMKGDRTLFIENVKREHDFHLTDASARCVYLTSMGHEWEKPYKKALEFVADQNCKLAFNPGHLQIHEGKDTVRAVFEKTDMLFVNKEEAEQILFHHFAEKIDNTKDYVKELAFKLQKLGPKIIVITNGKHGSYALSEQGEFYTREMFPGEVVERTGAGDAYTSGFLGATLSELSIPEAMTWGSINAASVVGTIGAEAGLLTKSQLEEKL